MAGGPVTVLFTDLVRSTELLQRVGDEQAQRVLRAHHRLLRDAVAVHGGREVKWLGDGLMTTFAASADAVRCAVAMQQRTRVRAAGERLAMRAGLHVGEVLPDEADYVGSSVVVARRLCDRAAAGQILCSGLVVELLGGRRAFHFGEVGPLELKGFAAPVAAYEVHYHRDDPTAMLRHTPFTGRAAELARLERRLEEARGGRGGVAMLVGEPGIGKTRTLEEFAETARAQEALVLWGRCYEGEAGRPYGPFAEALAEYARHAAAETLRAELGPGAAPLARLVPVLKARLPDLTEPVSLQPDEERTRLIDAVTQFLLALAARAPTVLVLDDLHGADAGTVALLRHVARFAPRGRLLLLGAYRDVEVDRGHPLADLLGVLPRERMYDQLALAGLEPEAVGELLEAVADQQLAQEIGAVLTKETSGNPFFIRGVLLHLLEERLLVRDGSRWRVAASLERLGLPHTVRQVIERRLDRLSATATRLLRVAAAFTGGVDFEVARRVAALDELHALDALDEALGAQLLESTGRGHRYDFTHALVRHTLYEALSPARQVRLHRQLAETMEAVYGDQAAEQAAEIARHYHRSADLPGAERGVSYCLAAAEQAERSAAFNEAATHLEAALALSPADAPERVSLHAHLGLTLIWGLRFDDALIVAHDAADRLAESEGHHAAADYLARAVQSMTQAGFVRGAWELARHGLRYAGDHDGPAWAWLMSSELLRREAEDRDHPGIPLDCPERREVARIFEEHGLLQGPFILQATVGIPASSRQEMLERGAGNAAAVTFGGGELRRAPELWAALAAASVEKGEIANAVMSHSAVARFHLSLGNFKMASAAFEEGVALARRLPGPSAQVMGLAGVTHERRMAVGTGWEEALGEAEAFRMDAVELRWLLAPVRVCSAVVSAHLGARDLAVGFLRATLPAVERAPGWAPNYVQVICDACEAAWLVQHLDHIDALERNLRDKVLLPDFRYPMRDARLAMARLCALKQCHAEAVDWFAKARTVLDAQGARPLRAIVDHDEALMYVRRDAPGDRDRAAPLLDTALTQFRALGMSGWIRNAEGLLKSCAGGGARAEGHSQ